MTRFAVLLLVACGSSGPGADWSGKALSETATAKVNGVAFKLELPVGMKLDADVKSDVTQMWKSDLDDNFSEPSVMVSYDAIPAKDVDEVVRDEMLGKRDIVPIKKAIPDGFLVISHLDNFGIVRAVVTRAKGTVHLKCTASQAKQGGVPNPEKTMVWLSQLCMTLEIQ